MKQLQWEEVVGNNTLVTIDNLQLRTGFITPILENTSLHTDYVGPSFFLGLNAQLKELNAALWIEGTWLLYLQREQDASLMKTFWG